MAIKSNDEKEKNPVKRKMINKDDLSNEDWDQVSKDPSELIKRLSKKYNLAEEVVEIEISKWMAGRQR